jgi:hypothetical protein
MNKVIFTKLYVDGEEISGHELAEAVRDVVEAEQAAYRGSGTLPSTSKPRKTNNPDLPDGVAWSDIT